jgi:uncharacterized protein YihD (DUF1040 family)
MRDPARIPEILKLVEEAWVKYPDLRLGQLLGNLEAYLLENIYYVEDTIIAEALKIVYYI